VVLKNLQYLVYQNFRCKSPNAAFFIRGNDIGYESLPENYIKRFVDADYLNQEHLNVSIL